MERILENIPLKDYTTFRIGGNARYFVEVTTTEELGKIATFAKEKTLPFFVLGGGSNILVKDEGFPGLVIKMNIKGLNIEGVGDEVRVSAGAGENWDEFVTYCVLSNVGGVENLSLIPGTVGAAPVQNIGAYGVEVKDVIEEVEVFNTETEKIEILKNEACGFEYRNSIFKRSENKKYIITRVIFKLKKNAEIRTEYKDIQEYIHNHKIKKEELSIKKIREIVIDIRIKKLPDVKKVGTAGSFFKNPIVIEEHFQELKEKYTEMPGFEVEGGIKIPAAWLLDKLCGFKGYRGGTVGVYESQALVLVNFGGATEKEITMLAEKMIECVKEKTKIVLEREVELIPKMN